MPTPSATGWKRWLPCRWTQHATRNPRHWSSPASPRFCREPFHPKVLRDHTRTLARGDKINPLDLIEWLEERGCEPEAQVTQKGEIALRGGILDVWPLTSPWPVRLEFFGDELESLRHFDPLTQISREEILSVTLPPAGELGLLKREAERGVHTASMPAGQAATEFSLPHNNLAAKRPQGRASLATLLDYLPPETIFLLCEPEQLAACADEYARQIPENDPFFIPWTDFLLELNRCGFTSIELADEEMAGTPASRTAQIAATDDQRAVPEAGAPIFTSLDAFRPLGERAPDPQIAEAQRREFFNQLHRWLRQVMPFMSSATTTASGSGLRKFGRKQAHSPQCMVHS